MTSVQAAIFIILLITDLCISIWGMIERFLHKGAEERLKLADKQIELCQNELNQSKKLLSFAVEDFRWLESHSNDEYGNCIFHGERTCLNCPLNHSNSKCSTWRHEAEALTLIGCSGKEH